MFVMKRQLIICLALAIGCTDAGPDSVGVTPSLQGADAERELTMAASPTGEHGRQWTWSEAVNLGPVVNSVAADNTPSMSPDELSLYFASQRTGGQGATDLWVSRRASTREPWGEPVNLGPVINTAGVEASASLSDDGHRLYFHSNRPGSQGESDLYVSYRADVNDNFGWTEPVNLGALVNTAFQESGAEFVNATLLLFNRRAGPGSTPPQDLYMVRIGADGLPIAAPQPIVELNSPFSDFGAEVSDDEREILFGSGRPGFGNNDVWRSTRRTKHDPWMPPENLGPVINTEANDQHPSLSNHGRTLIFTSNRPGGIGSDDLWMSTRRPGAQSNREH